VHARFVSLGSRNGETEKSPFHPSFQNSIFAVIGLGQPLQRSQQQCAFWRQKAERIWCVSDPAFFLSALRSDIKLKGRELGSYALQEYTSVKSVHWNFGEKLDWPLSA
jgi:hypothetical protein